MLEVSETGLTILCDTRLKGVGRGIVLFKLRWPNVAANAFQGKSRVVHELLAETQFLVGIEIPEFQFERKIYLQYLQALEILSFPFFLPNPKR